MPVASVPLGGSAGVDGKKVTLLFENTVSSGMVEQVPASNL